MNKCELTETGNSKDNEEPIHEDNDNQNASSQWK